MNIIKSIKINFESLYNVQIKIEWAIENRQSMSISSLKDKIMKNSNKENMHHPSLFF